MADRKMTHKIICCGQTVVAESSGSGDDEDDCPEGRYSCTKSDDCIPESWLCDGENDCGNWEDESVSMCGKW